MPSPKKILVVDDSETIREAVKSVLENEYEVFTFPDGHEALVYLSHGNHPDLILTDMEMPNMNGRTFVRRIYSDPRFSDIPVIFITSVASEMLINSFKSMGVVDFIIKPFKPEDIISKIKELLKA